MFLYLRRLDHGGSIDRSHELLSAQILIIAPWPDQSKNAAHISLHLSDVSL